MVALTGPAGIGKTTALRAASDQLGSAGVRITWIDLTDGAPSQVSGVVTEIQVAAPRGAGPRVLVVDNAHLLLPETLELLHGLVTTALADQPAWQVILAGRPELWDVADTARLGDMGTAIPIRCGLGPMTETEAIALVARRTRPARGRGA